MDQSKVQKPPAQYGPPRRRKTFVLCFDGTGNKFSGTEGDSNILKIYRMLDRGDPDQLHYYQPGIGTYVDTQSLSHTSLPSRLNSWFQKARDSAVGTSFDEHVMGGYKFLMRYYSAGDDIYFFGFSRGAYIARFLAEMLDYVGLLSAGNEEMARFAWKAFAHWQQRHDKTAKDLKKKVEMYEFLTGFRETFSRPVRRIRFLGLFDTVNSVPRFENAWMQRSKFPYTARSSAVVIRHAVGIDERRAKFRQDLISETKIPTHHRHRQEGYSTDADNIVHFENHLQLPGRKNKQTRPSKPEPPKADFEMIERYRRPSLAAQARTGEHHRQRMRSASPSRSLGRIAESDCGSSVAPSGSQISLQLPEHIDDDEDADEEKPQDLQEIWFPGCHADIGGGWPLSPGEQVPLSHGPLVWIVREAQKAGLRFDYEKLLKLKCVDDTFGDNNGQDSPRRPRDPSIPQIEVNDIPDDDGRRSPTDIGGSQFIMPQVTPTLSPFRKALKLGAAKGKMHDCLQFGNGLPRVSVIGWKVMEYLPFRRMDLQPDGSWNSISWPLPKGEVRDVPNEAWIHTSALQRMKAIPDYRPGNLIVGGGGRGVRVAPKELGMGEWVCVREEGDPVGESFVRKSHAQTQSETTEVEKDEEK